MGIWARRRVERIENLKVFDEIWYAGVSPGARGPKSWAILVRCFWSVHTRLTTNIKTASGARPGDQTHD